MTPVEFLSKEVIKKTGGAQKKIAIALEKFYGMIMMNVECPCFDKDKEVNEVKKPRGTGALRTTF